MTETAQIRFRTAVGGFHKGDVTEYITKTAAAHQAELQAQAKTIEALTAENQALQERLNLFMLSAALEPAAPAEPAPADPPSEKEALPELNMLELAAYRRAEAAERLANQRAKKLYESLDTICQDTSAQFQAADTAAQEAAEAIVSQVQGLEAACRRLTESLEASRRQLEAMGALVPDPAEGLEAES